MHCKMFSNIPDLSTNAPSHSGITALSWQRGLHNSMKEWAMPCRADGLVIVKSSDKTWCSGQGNGKPLQYSCCKNPTNSMKRQKYVTPEHEPPRLEGVWYTTGQVQKAICDSSRRNESAGPKLKWCSVVDVSGSENKEQCYKEQYCIGTWKVRPMNQGILDVFKHDMGRVNINISGIREQWMGMGKFNLDGHYIITVGKNPLEVVE